MICLFLRGAFASNQLENRDATLKGNLLTMVQPVMSTGLENILLIFGGLNAGQIDDAGGEGGHDQALRVKVQDDKSKRLCP